MPTPDARGVIRLPDVETPHLLSLHLWRDGAWRMLPLRASGAALVADGGDLAGNQAGVQFRLERIEQAWRYELAVQSNFPTRVAVRLELPKVRRPFHLIPGVLFGDNNLAHAEPGHFPNLTARYPGSVSCATYWELRADRASHPVSLLCGEGVVGAVSIDPYSDGRPEAEPGHAAVMDDFIRNGLWASLAVAGGGPSCGASLGYANLPRTFLNKDQWTPTTEHLVREARASGLIFVLAGERTEAHRVIRAVYARHRETPVTPISQREAVTALTDAFLNINWHDQTGRNALGMQAPNASAFLGGQPIRENFTNMRCVDPQKTQLRAWRSLAEVGWTGGGVIGYPLLAAGHRLGNSLALRRARHALDWVAKAFNPASGLLWDVCGPGEGTRLNWWWSGYLVKDAHCAYTNGTGLYYLLKAWLLERQFGVDHPAWLDTAQAALATIVKLQRKDGNFGYTYRADKPGILDKDGFAGVWFAAALALGHRATGRDDFLQAARRGLAYYHPFVRRLDCWGSPMDTWKSNDQEGNLGFLRAARHLHEITRDDLYAAMLADSAEYEYLWRVGFRARPQYRPLKGSHWNSCGGSITSVSNPHIHPMGIYLADDLNYLARLGGDPYHQARNQDGNHWGINVVSLYPEVATYAPRGVLTERFCPSDGLTVETFPDGSPSSLWFAYNGWAAAAVLEGLAETLPPE